MKNFVKLFGIIALVAVIGFSLAACGGGAGDSGGGNWESGTYTGFSFSIPNSDVSQFGIPTAPNTSTRIISGTLSKADSLAACNAYYDAHLGWVTKYTGKTWDEIELYITFDLSQSSNSSYANTVLNTASNGMKTHGYAVIGFYNGNLISQTSVYAAFKE